MMDEGTPIDELRVTPDRYLPVRYAGAAEDFNPVHVDREFALSVGLPGAILHGLYGMALVVRAGLAAIDADPRRLKRAKVQFRGMGVAEQEIVVRGIVARRDGTEVVVEATADQGESALIRHGEVALDVAPVR